jgi:uncharacterized protein (TIGR02145 family)
MFLVAVFSYIPALKVNAQNYLISFEGTGESTTVEKVEVENLSSGALLTLNGFDILQLTEPTDIAAMSISHSAIRIYPNPMFDQSILEIFSSVSGKALITVTDITGNTIAQIQGYLEHTRQEFRLSGLKKGLYLVSVLGNSFQYSEKIISYGRTNGIQMIEEITLSNSPGDEKTIEKSAVVSPSIIDMPYSSGDRLKFVVRSGTYSTIKTDIPTQDKALTFNFVKCTDGDNNNYPIVQIGDQIWMAENLKTTKYNDGTKIPLVTDNCEWGNLKTPGLCWYNNDEAIYKATYGALYNWFAADTSELCPTGWHVPSDEEWKTLERFLGMTWESADESGFRGIDQGTQLKSTTGWKFGGNGSNSSGFSGLPSGARWLDTGCFHNIEVFAGWWSSTESFEDNAVSRYIYFSSSNVHRAADNSCYNGKQNGLSVRCIKD